MRLKELSEKSFGQEKGPGSIRPWGRKEAGVRVDEEAGIVHRYRLSQNSAGPPVRAAVAGVQRTKARHHFFSPNVQPRHFYD